MARTNDKSGFSANNSPALRLSGSNGVQEWKWGSWWQAWNLPRPGQDRFWELRINIGATPTKYWNSKSDVRFDGDGNLWVRDTSVPQQELWLRWDPPADHGVVLVDPWGGIWAANNFKWNCIQAPTAATVIWKRAAGGPEGRTGWGV